MKMILALDLDRLIGRADGSLPWRLPGDLARFKRLTMGGKLIVGRKTRETLPDDLPGRIVLVASNKRDGKSGDDLAALCEAYPDAWIAGGGEVYRAALDLGVVTEVYATRVMRSFRVDSIWELADAVHAPPWEHAFRLVSVELGADENTVYEIWRRT